MKVRLLVPILLALAACTPAAEPVATPPAPPSVLAELPRQTLPATGCALFLWEVASRRLVAMATTAPAAIKLGGAGTPLPRDPGAGDTLLGFTPRASYGGGRVTLDVALEVRQGLLGGAVVRDGSLAVTAADASTIVVPVGGLVGCR